MNVEMHFLPNGVLLHDYGHGSCLSCGGRATATHDDCGREHARCAACGEVVYVVFDSDTGAPVEGFMTPGELRGLHLLEAPDKPE